MLSFRNRLLIILIGLVVGAQIVTLVTALPSTYSVERRRADTQLTNGASVARERLAQHEKELANAVSLLVADWGLREAMASGDAPTVASALDNHAARIGADLTLALDNDGNVIGRGAGTARDDADLIRALKQYAPDDRLGARFLVSRSGIYQVFMAATPDDIGQIALGFSVDRRLADELNRLVRVQVAFLTGSPQGLRFVAGSSGLAGAEDEVIATALRESPTVIDLAGTAYLATAAHLATGEPGLDIALLKPMDEVMEPFWTLARNLGLIFGLTLVIAVAAGIYLGGSAARPVQRLAAGAERIAAGDYSQRVESSGGRELADLAAAFNSMQAGIAERESRLKHVARHDAATGLVNRIHLEEWLAERIPEVGARRLVLVQFAIVNLQEISATLGFRIAARLVWHISRELADVALRADVVARLDGAEFAVVGSAADADEAMAFAAQVQQRCIRPLVTEGIRLQASVVLGVAIAPDDAVTAEELLRRARAAIESAQQARQWIARFVQSSDEAQRRRLTLGADLPRALQDGQLYLLYQPKVRLTDRSVTGVEALVRWQHPLLGLVSPAEFVPIAERTGTSAQLTQWVLRNALGQLALWQRAGVQIETAVNLSAADLLDQQLIHEILGALRDAGLPGGSLILEITESVLLHDPETVRRNMEMLRLAGVRFSIDDFGTGYSSLSQLRELAADELKIDQAFVRGRQGKGGADVSMLRAIVAMAHGLGLRTVAEGVEQEEHCQLLTGLGCEYAQGYLFSRPVTAADLAPMLNAGTARREIAQTASLRVLELRRRDT